MLLGPRCAKIFSFALGLRRTFADAPHVRTCCSGHAVPQYFCSRWGGAEPLPMAHMSAESLGLDPHGVFGFRARTFADGPHVRKCCSGRAVPKHVRSRYAVPNYFRSRLGCASTLPMAPVVASGALGPDPHRYFHSRLGCAEPLLMPHMSAHVARATLYHNILFALGWRRTFTDGPYVRRKPRAGPTWRVWVSRENLC